MKVWFTFLCTCQAGRPRQPPPDSRPQTAAPSLGQDMRLCAAGTERPGESRAVPSIHPIGPHPQTDRQTDRQSDRQTGRQRRGGDWPMGQWANGPVGLQPSQPGQKHSGYLTRVSDKITKLQSKVLSQPQGRQSLYFPGRLTVVALSFPCEQIRSHYDETYSYSYYLSRPVY